MASFKKYKKKDGNTAWRFQVYLGVDPKTGKPIKTTKQGFKTQREAKLALSRLVSEFEENGLKESQTKTYQEIYDLWIDEYISTVKESTLLKTERTFKNHILPAFGEYYIDEITPMMAQEQMNIWHQKMEKARVIMNYTGMVFDYAIRLQLITLNPTKVIKKPAPKQKIKEDKDLNFYDKKELKEFFSVLEQSPNIRAHVYFRLLAFTGIRKGESLALKWSDVDFKNKTLNINKAVARKESGLYIQTPKTAASIRRISIDDRTLEILKDFRNNTAKDKLIFRSESDGILSPAKTRKWLLVIQDAVDAKRKEAEKKPMKRISTHGFRHTHASLLFESGATIKDVQYRLGHSDIQTTMDIYTHVSKTAKEQLAKRFNSFVDF
ncbi:MAG TPA: site-specific integrase [Bacilli bacterium]|nr:site-specific integrase [Bacilli bacterium]